MKELSPQEWLQEISTGLEFRRLYGLEDEWKTLEGLYYHVDRMVSEFSAPNLLASLGDALMSELTVPVPVFTVRPRRLTDPSNASILESVDNDLVGDLALVEAMEDAVLHAFLFGGRGILKIGYDSEWGWDPGLDFGGPEAPLGLSLSQFDKKGRRIEFAESVKPGMPWVKAVLPHDIVVPWGVKRLEDSPWIAHRVIRHIEAIRGDRKYSGTRDLKAVMSGEDFVKSYQTTMKPYRAGQDTVGVAMTREGRKAVYVEMWEIHDQRTGRIIVVATGNDDKVLRDEDDLLQIEGLPFVSFAFVPQTRNFWVSPDAHYLKANQAELSDISLQATKQRRLSILRFLFGEDAFEEEELSKALSADVGVAARVKAGMDITRAIVSLTPPNNNMLLYQDAEHVRRDSREMIGLSRNQLGEFEASGRRSATEASIVKASSDQRMGRRMIVVRNAYLKVMRKVNAMLFRFWTTPRWAKVTGPEGLESWVPFVASNLQGSYAYDLDFSVEQGLTRQDRQAKAFGLYQALSQDPYIDPIDLRRYLTRQFNDPQITAMFEKGFQNAALRIQMQQAGMQGSGQGAPSQGGATQ